MLLIAIAVGIAFAQGWKYPFTSWDDGVNLAGNEYIRGFTRQNLKWMLTEELLGVFPPDREEMLLADYAPSLAARLADSPVDVPGADPLRQVSGRTLISSPCTGPFCRFHHFL